MTQYQVTPTSQEPIVSEGGEQHKNGGVNGYFQVSVGDAQPLQCRTYKRRWLILALFVAYSMSNAFQWIQYAIINHIIIKYYGVDSFAVDWLSMIYMLTYIPLIFPAAWLLDKKGLRTAVLIGSLGTALGSWIKVLSVSPDRFYVTFAGQTVVAVSQIFILGIPPRLAAVWFGPNQVSSACAIGVFGNQLGIAIGCYLPTVMVKNHDDLNEIGSDLSIMFYGVAAVTTTILMLIIFVFKDAPPLPPSLARAAALSSEPESYFRSILKLVRNRPYMLLLTTYGMNAGVFYALSTLLNQVVLPHFPGHDEDIGRIGLFMVLSGMVGSVVSGLWLDKTHMFKQTTVGIYCFSFLGMLAYTFSMSQGSIAVVYVMAILLGFFMTGYLPVGFEFAAEITYPEPEGTSSGLLNASAQVFGILLTMGASWLLKASGDMAANLTLAAMLLVGTGLTMLIKAQLKRQSAQNQGKETTQDEKLEPKF